MLNRILEKFSFVKNLKANVSYLSKELDKLKIMLDVAEAKVGNPKYVVSKVMGRGIKFFDYDSLKFEEKKNYYNDAQSALRNKTLMNELNHITADCVEYIAKNSKNFDEVREMRMQINFSEILRDRLSNIQNPENYIEDDNREDNIKALDNLI